MPTVFDGYASKITSPDNSDHQPRRALGGTADIVGVFS